MSTMSGLTPPLAFCDKREPRPNVNNVKPDPSRRKVTKSVAERLRTHRERLGLSRKKLAALLGNRAKKSLEPIGYVSI